MVTRTDVGNQYLTVTISSRHDIVLIVGIIPGVCYYVAFRMRK